MADEQKKSIRDRPQFRYDLDVGRITEGQGTVRDVGRAQDCHGVIDQDDFRMQTGV
jgi:hypothetical protein